MSEEKRRGGDEFMEREKRMNKERLICGEFRTVREKPGDDDFRYMTEDELEALIAEVETHGMLAPPASEGSDYGRGGEVRKACRKKRNQQKKGKNSVYDLQRKNYWGCGSGYFLPDDGSHGSGQGHGNREPAAGKDDGGRYGILSERE